MSRASAELCKLSLNCYVTMKIAFACMVGDIADRVNNADAEAILKALGQDKRIGGKCLSHGYGFGGPCFPRDNRALASFAEKVGVQALLPKATEKYNREHAKVFSDTILAAIRQISANITSMGTEQTSRRGRYSPSSGRNFPYTIPVTGTRRNAHLASDSRTLSPPFEGKELCQYRPGDMSLIFENVCYKENCDVPIIDESQKLLVARQIMESLKSTENEFFSKRFRIVIRDTDKVCHEVRREYGDLFKYERTDDYEDQLENRT